jgi:hypothetical protein
VLIGFDEVGTDGLHSRTLGGKDLSRYFGEIRQNGYVVRDIAEAMKHWGEVMGVGPFFYIEEAPIQNFRYRGEPSDMIASIALANSGSL